MDATISRMPAPRWVDRPDDLRASLARCGDLVALDTEFQRTDTFYPIAGLFQLAVRDAVWLVDPLAIEDFSQLVGLLEDPTVTKVMHACPEDLELLWCRLRTHPANVFDTQLAYAFLSTRYSIGFTGLVAAELGIELQQSQTRSNWLRRPLSAEQLRYAAEDAWYLIALYEQLAERLERSGRLDWLREDLRSHTMWRDGEPDAYYRDVGRAWSLDRTELGRLKALCTWRELRTRELDIPRKRLVPDDDLFTMARQSVLTLDGLAQMLPPVAVKRHGSALIAAHAQALPVDETLPAPLTPGENRQVKRLRDIASAKAEQLGMAPELLARRRDVETLFRHFRQTGELSARYAGWRRDVVGDALLQALRGM
ncbi:MAG: ribonuclease D [Pseudomonadales bacterium]